ncbi:uncharacterized protein LOC126336613 [Schistocerca gregaria]|uniref:uncharacterized protein LOC126336613 n=1 Tax=Schistocerca gregaria TaxID=7010 RepID=UPI00211EE3EA|nr:uncharacterized protein LOC126336613 [Schistocerca gregaria]XP_049856442.1 uncharacterized protein LOC126336613 [Schistocerca gregaria]
MSPTTPSVITLILYMTSGVNGESTEELSMSLERRLPSFLEKQNIICTGSQNNTDKKGVCLDRNVCRFSGGKVIGSCPVSGGCCYYEHTCYSSSVVKLSYFVNPATPPHHCTFQVETANTNVCQIRLDFEHFEIAQPTAHDTTCYGGLCDRREAAQCHIDSFKVLSGFGGISSLGFTSLCGFNSGQHIYVPVNASQGVNSVTLSFHLADRNLHDSLFHPAWRIRVTQLECVPQQYVLSGQKRVAPLYTDFNSLAPPGCLQYYTERSGNYQTFNFNSEEEIKQQYTADMNYAICFHRPSDACGIMHIAEKFEVGSYHRQGGSETDHHCDSYSVSDYLFIPNGKTSDRRQADKYCGTSLNPNISVTAISPGPLYVIFRSDSVILNDYLSSERGFKIKYQILNNCQ